VRTPADDQLAALIGVLPRLCHPASSPDDAAARAALVRARTAVGARLLLACARERLVSTALTGMSLRAGLFDLPLRRLRAFELHAPDLDAAPALPAPGTLARALLPELARPALDRLARELDDSAFNLALARLYADLRERTCSTGQPWPAPLDPENLVVDGHPWHPMSKTRLGLEPAENVDYGPDQRALGPVHAVDVPAAWAAVEGPFLDLTRDLFPAPAPGWLRLPVHALQRRRLPALLGPRWGELARPTDLPPLPARALLSLRTVALEGHPLHLKLSTDMLTTSARRVVSPQSVRNGPRLSALLAALQAADPLARRGLRIQPDLAAAGLAPAAGECAAQLAVIVRPDPAPLAAELVREDMSLDTLPPGHAPEVIVCAALGERRPGGDLLLRELSAAYPGDPPARLSAFLSDYLDLLLPPLLRLWTAHGVALEAHLQNTLLVVAGGRPRGFVVRDLGGIRVYLPRLARPLELAPGSFVAADDLADGQSKLMHVLLHAHLAAVLGWIEDAGGPDTAASWPRVRAGLERCLAAWSADPRLARACADDRAFLLAPRCRMKALLAMRIHERSSDYEYTEVANALAAGYPPGAAT
jgi:siderophore synthetase component